MKEALPVSSAEPAARSVFKAVGNLSYTNHIHCYFLQQEINRNLFVTPRGKLDLNGADCK